MQFTYDKGGRSVKELALLKMFVRTSYVTPEGEPLSSRAIDAWAEVIQERVAAADALSQLVR
jgi:hypothetical protein